MTRFAPLLAALLLVSASPMAFGYGDSPEPYSEETSSGEPSSSGHETNESPYNTSSGSWSQESPSDNEDDNRTDEVAESSTRPTGGNATNASHAPPQENATGDPTSTGASSEGADGAGDASATRSKGADEHATHEDERGAQDSGATPPATEGSQRARDGAAPGEKDRGRVSVRETPDGFETVPPPASKRPTVSVDAHDGLVRVERPGVEPLATHLVSLLEYEDEDGDGTYDLGERVVASHALRGREPTVIAGDGPLTRNILHELDGGGRLVLRFTLDPVDEGVGAKFDVRIEDYPFASPGTRLALGIHVESTSPLRPAEVNGAPAIAVSKGTEAAYLSWVPNVTVDGADHPVGWSVHTSTSDASAIVYWSYPQGARILHDPALGVLQVARDLLGEPLPFAVGLATTGLLLGVGFEARRRTRR